MVISNIIKRLSRTTGLLLLLLPFGLSTLAVAGAIAFAAVTLAFTALSLVC